MLTLRKTSWLVTWAYLLGGVIPIEHWHPVETNQGLTRYVPVCGVSLCVLFWRVVFVTPMKILLIGGPLGFLVAVAIVFPAEFMTMAGGLLAIAAVIVGGCFTMVFLEERYPGGPTDIKPIQLASLAIDAVKKRYCPIIRLVE